MLTLLAEGVFPAAAVPGVETCVKITVPLIPVLKSSRTMVSAIVERVNKKIIAVTKYLNTVLCSALGWRADIGGLTRFADR